MLFNAVAAVCLGRVQRPIGPSGELLRRNHIAGYQGGDTNAERQSLGDEGGRVWNGPVPDLLA